MLVIDADSGRSNADRPRLDSGVQSEVEDLWHRLHDQVERIVTNLAGGPSGVADAVQEAFASACDDWTVVRALGNRQRAWLIKVAWRQLCKWRERQNREASARNDRFPAWALDTAEIAGLRDLAMRTIGDLPPRQALIIGLVHFDGMSVAEVSVELRIAESTVRQHLSRARATIARRMGVVDDFADGSASWN